MVQLLAWLRFQSIYLWDEQPVKTSDILLTQRYSCSLLSHWVGTSKVKDHACSLNAFGNQPT